MRIGVFAHLAAILLLSPPKTVSFKEDIMEGPTVSDLPIPDDAFVVSYSQVQAWLRCMKLWDHSYNEGLMSKTEPDYLRLGSYIHVLLEIFYNHKKYGFPDREVRELIENYAIEKLTVDLPVESLGIVTLALRLVLRYIDDVAPVMDAGARILGVEHHFAKQLVSPKGREFYLQGYIDLILEIEGKRWIVDHKSTGNRIWSITELMMDGQLTTYAAVIPDIFGVAVNFFNTYDYKDWWTTPIEKLYKRLPAHRSEAEKNNVLHNFGVIVDDMLDRRETGNYPYSLTKDCARCKFNELCLIELKGFDEASLESYKREAFTLKSASGYTFETKTDFESFADL